MERGPVPQVPSGCLSEQGEELSAAELAVSEDLRHQAWADGLAGMCSNHGGPAVLMLEEVVASSHPHYREAGAFQTRDELTARDDWQAGHAGTDTR